MRKITKHQSKAIRELAMELPPTRERVVVSRVPGYDPEGRKAMVPVFGTIEVNHERRIRHAFQAHGISGIEKYLEFIMAAQRQRREKFIDNNVPQETVLVDMENKNHEGDINGNSIRLSMSGEEPECVEAGSGCGLRSDSGVQREDVEGSDQGNISK